jgi:hypothetical protein
MTSAASGIAVKAPTTATAIDNRRTIFNALMLLPHIFFIDLIILHMYAFFDTNPPYHDKQ